MISSKISFGSMLSPRVDGLVELPVEVAADLDRHRGALAHGADASCFVEPPRTSPAANTPGSAS